MWLRQVPAYVGICRMALIELIAERIQKMQEIVHERVTAREALRIANESCIVLYTKCAQTVTGRHEVFWAAPESEHFSERFDFVEERIDEDGLWSYPGCGGQPCRPVIALRGFVNVDLAAHELAGGESLQLALGRNLVPHRDSPRTCDAGSPIHPMLTVTHCLWEFQR